MLEPFWSIFGVVIIFYLPLYMKELGLLEVQMGIINTTGLFIAFIWHLFAAPITNRLGRKKTVFIFDLIAWTIPMFIWAVAQNFWYFLIAAVINATVRVVYIAWFCLVIEDTPFQKRSRVFGILYIINAVAGMLMPVMGYFIARYGTVSSMRVVYSAGMISMTLMFIIRNRLVSETKAGKELMKRHSSISILQSMKNYLDIILRTRKNKKIILLIMIYITTNLIISINFFFVLYLRDKLYFSEKIIFVIPGVSAAINIFLYIFILPRVRKFSEEKILTAGFSIATLGALLFLLIPKSNILFLLITTSILAIGFFVMQTFRDSVLMNSLGEHEKADVYSAVQTLTVLVCIPSGYLSGLAYSIDPILPFIAILTLFVISVAISSRLIKHAAIIPTAI